MKFLKFIFVCLFIIFEIACLFAHTPNNETFTALCFDLPELYSVYISNERSLHYEWNFSKNAFLYILEYKVPNGCADFEGGSHVFDTGGNLPSGPPQCPPDVWTELPGATLRASSPPHQNSNGIVMNSFIACTEFEFRMKVIWNDNTLYSNVLSYLYDDGSCPDCMPERNLTADHETDIIIQVENKITSNAEVLANVIYKAGERIELKSGFSAKAGYHFKVINESCSKP